MTNNQAQLCSIDYKSPQGLKKEALLPKPIKQSQILFGEPSLELLPAGAVKNCRQMALQTSKCDRTFKQSVLCKLSDFGFTRKPKNTQIWPEHYFKHVWGFLLINSRSRLLEKDIIATPTLPRDKNQTWQPLLITDPPPIRMGAQNSCEVVHHMN